MTCKELAFEFTNKANTLLVPADVDVLTSYVNDSEALHNLQPYRAEIIEFFNSPVSGGVQIPDKGYYLPRRGLLGVIEGLNMDNWAGAWFADIQRKAGVTYHRNLSVNSTHFLDFYKVSWVNLPDALKILAIADSQLYLDLDFEKYKQLEPEWFLTPRKAK